MSNNSKFLITCFKNRIEIRYGHKYDYNIVVVLAFNDYVETILSSTNTKKKLTFNEEKVEITSLSFNNYKHEHLKIKHCTLSKI